MVPETQALDAPLARMATTSTTAGLSDRHIGPYVGGGRREADEARKPKLIAVTARGVSIVPGAGTCPLNGQTVATRQQPARSWLSLPSPTSSRGRLQEPQGRACVRFQKCP
jgi:hypothetical protein